MMMTNPRESPEMERSDEVDEIFDHLIKTGAIVLTGMSPRGEPVYNVTAKCEEIFPEFYKVHRQELNATAYDLWARGLVEIVFGDSEERIIFDDRHYKLLKECYEDLTDEEADFLIALGAPLDFKRVD
jgi:hypothetical protein